MFRLFTTKKTVQSLCEGCSNKRHYAIMNRAKQRAGIEPTFTKPATKRPVNKTPAVSTLIQKELPVKPVPNVQFRKPAGIQERLIKVPKDITQPDNPHLLKVAIIGPANAGKSTLVNRLIGQEVSGVSSKAHTTRERILAVLTEDQYQIIFLDTPGVIPDNNHAKMNRTLATSSWRSLEEADHVVLVLDAYRSLQQKARVTEEYILSRLHDMNIPATLVFNKMDLLQEDIDGLDEVRDRYMEGYPQIGKVVYLSALHGDKLDEIKSIMFESAIPRPWIYDKDQKTEMSDLKHVEEAIRIEFFKRLHQYIPYMLKQENVGWTVLRDGTLRIDQNVYVERDSQHKIVVGTNGRVINAVVENATAHLSSIFNRPVKLFIKVKTKKA